MSHVLLRKKIIWDIQFANFCQHQKYPKVKNQLQNNCITCMIIFKILHIFTD